MIKIIKDLDITASGVSVFNRKWQPVHFTTRRNGWGLCRIFHDDEPAHTKGSYS